MSLRDFWNYLESCKSLKRDLCSKCPLASSQILLIKPSDPSRVYVTVVSEGPTKYQPVELLTSLANHPTYTYIQALFGGRFRPIGDNATAYWTHVRKCFIDGREKSGKLALNICQRYLKRELTVAKPKLLVTVGERAYRSVRRSLGAKPSGKDYTKYFLRQLYGEFDHVKIGNGEATLVTVPHPSGRNRLWNNPTEEMRKAFQAVVEEIDKYIP